MAAYIRQRPAGWFWLIGQAVTLTGLVACAAWLAARLGLTFAAPPGWAFAVASGAVLGGGIALLNKRLVARILFGVALLAAAGEFGLLVANGPLPIGHGVSSGVLLAAALSLTWFADYSRRHGWIF